MVFRVRMPRIDPNVEEGTIGRWLTDRGSEVRAGEPLVEIITDKATFELEAERAGVVRAHVAAEKSVVPVGYVIALISDGPDEPLPDVADENAAVLKAYRESLLAGGTGPSVEPPQGPAPQADSGAPRATPAARRLAAREGIPLASIDGGRRAVLRREDVEQELRRRGRESGR